MFDVTASPSEAYLLADKAGTAWAASVYINAGAGTLVASKNTAVTQTFQTLAIWYNGANGTKFWVAFAYGGVIHLGLMKMDMTDVPAETATVTVNPFTDNEPVAITFARQGASGGATMFWDDVARDATPTAFNHWCVQFKDFDSTGAAEASPGQYDTLWNYRLYTKGFNDSQTTSYVPYVTVARAGCDDISNAAHNAAGLMNHVPDPTGLVVCRKNYTQTDVQEGTVIHGYLRVVARVNYNRARSRLDLTVAFDTVVVNLPHVRSLAAGLDSLRTCCTVGTRVGDYFVQYEFGGSVVSLELSPAAPKSISVLNGHLVLSGGYVGGFDGVDSFEDGFHHDPVGVAADGSASDGATKFKVVYVWSDHKGNLHRSAPSASFDADVPATGVKYYFPWPPPSSMMHAKNGIDGVEVTAELYCVNPTGDGLYRLTAHGKPTQGTGNWAGYAYLATPTGSTTYRDPVYTSAGEMDNNHPPAMKDLAYDGRRLYGVSSEHPSEIRYSKLITPGYAPEWNDNFYMRIPAEGGSVVSVVAMDDKIVVFKERATYYFYGDGPDNNGTGAFSAITTASPLVGCVARSAVALSDVGV
ncbi:MAG TPA: hypothetical protein VIY48_14810, partial [Candidatus Paceibacterota bacterium]